MSINSWWSAESSQRYWMEITDRDELGGDLNAPQLDGRGHEYWSYSLVTEAVPGDIVLHWHTNWIGRPALVGWSEVTGPLSVDGNYEWMAHGTQGKARGVATVGRGWRNQCGRLHELSQPIDGARLASVEPQLQSVRGQLSAQHKGTLYFPFIFYRPGQIRAAQAYVTKFPAELLSIFPELEDVLRPGSNGRDGRPGHATKNRVGVGVGTANIADPKLKRAIETHAERVAEKHYRNKGATDVKYRGKPFDLIIEGLGPERHVEVKGSSVTAVAVTLTANEVLHAHNHQPTDLIVVDKIKFKKRPDGEYETSGGELQLWENWTPDDSALSPTEFRYDLPE